MDTRWLRDFLTLAEVRSFTRAAQLQHTSQAAFSRRIQSLENWLGARLIDRSRYPLYLTEAGESLQREADRLLAQLEGLRVTKTRFKAQRNVRIALPYAIAELWLPAWWKLWCGRDHQWTCQARVGSVLETTADFAAGSSDLLINYYRPTQRIPLDAAVYERTTLLSDMVRPYCSKHLLEKRRFRFPGTKHQPVPYFHYAESAYFHRIVESVVGDPARGFHGTLLGESEMSQVLAGFAMTGLGVAWLPDSSLMHRPNHALVNLDETGEWSVEVDIVAFVNRQSTTGHIGEIWRRMRAG